MNWGGTEKFDCFCGRPACVWTKEGKPELFCVAHSYDAGLMAPLPKEKPVDWPETPTKAQVYDLVKLGFLEAHPRIAVYLVSEDRNQAWRLLTEEERSYVRHVAKAAPEGSNPDDDDIDAA